MFSCCDFIYCKYLNSDKSVDWTQYIKCIKEKIFFQIEEICEKQLDIIQKSGSPSKKIGYTIDIQELFKEDNICKCSCHIKGTEILH